MITYRVDARATHCHEFHLTVVVPQPAEQQSLSLPVWIPGSYMVREFARHVSLLQAQQGGQPVPLSQTSKTSWLALCSGRKPLTVTYRVYAFDTSVRAAFLSDERGFFNGTSLFLRIEGREHEPHAVQLTELPKGWAVATAMGVSKVDERGRGTYQAANYDELIDHPVELGCFWRGKFLVRDIPHEFVVTGALPDVDHERLLTDARRICEAQIAFWHGKKKPPFDRYVFLLNTVDDGYGGLEHRNSTALLAARRELPQIGKAAEVSDGYVTLLGLISHEYFHTWNVKRLRPREFTTYDLTQENYTELLWFFEGFTSYYDDLCLLRAGLIDVPRYLKLLAKTISSVLATPGRHAQSVAQASFDAWVKYYRPDENSVNATISYYAKGSLIALALDLLLRCDHQANLDDVMRMLWQRSAGGPISQDDIVSVLREVAGCPMDHVLQSWVHGTEDLPLRELLGRFGIAWQHHAATLAQKWGLKVSESALTGVKVTHVLRGSVAEAAGLAAGDELLAVDGWRVRRLEDAQRVINASQKSTVIVSRDQRVLNLSLVNSGAQGPMGSVVLSESPLAQSSEVALRRAWMHT